MPGRAVRGGGAGGAVRGAAALGAGIATALGLVGRLRPRLVVGVGGYASAAMVVAAWLRRVPVVLQEQNAIPGATNRSLARLARVVCVGFAEASRYLPAGRAVHTGNPLRPEVLAAPPAPPAPGTGLLVFGGSQGAQRINAATLAAMERLGPAAAGLRIVHQTGAAEREQVAAGYARLGLAARVEAFIQDMGAAYRAADLVVARAGAMSCSEIAAMGLPAILVPYPFAVDDHQRANAEVLVHAGAARMILDRELDGATLGAALAALAGDADVRRAMAARARAVARPEAAEAAADVCCRVMRPASP
ncbi:MAG: UDP-N-acetylglucosamine--N-acetylmuramyl-(pentapeptide) pyrophosphoryl-undecaprenol N-acetylglucosamine transferase [bacterium]|nr:UDP-N-acetylglucosamine--N-acetylmuramyl-(pentapeptide) pyrophosphoryl-undecaprenol N-acetylglucosamine transferase [bacterium]